MSKLKGRSQHPGRKGRSLRSDHAHPKGLTPTPPPSATRSSAPPPEARSSAPPEDAAARESVVPSSVVTSDVIAAEIRAKLADDASPEPAAASTPEKADEGAREEADKPSAKAKDDKAERESRTSSPVVEERASKAEAKPAAKGAAAKSASRPPEKDKKGAKPKPEIEDEDSHSLSGAFFHRDADSVPPHVDDFHDPEDHEPERVQLLTPEALERRARFRRIVAAVVGFAGVVSAAVLGRAITSSGGRSVAPPPPVVTAVAPPVPTPSVLPTPPPPPAQEPAPSAVAPQPSASAVASAATSAAAPEPSASAKAEPDKKEDAPKGDGDPVALRKEALKLLNMGKTKDAIPIARSAIAADPTDATAYLYLGSALQDSGKWKDGIEVYCDCVRTATKGPVSECRQMGGHK
jgi:chemotaxis protein histidine kinase CheA